MRRIVRLHGRHTVQFHTAQAPVKVVRIRQRALAGRFGGAGGGRRWLGVVDWCTIASGSGIVVNDDVHFGWREGEWDIINTNEYIFRKNAIIPNIML